MDWIEVEKRPDCAQIQAYLKELTGASSVSDFGCIFLLNLDSDLKFYYCYHDQVPRVFVDGKCIGGCDDTTAADSSGKLQTLLTECGALE